MHDSEDNFWRVERNSGADFVVRVVVPERQLQGMSMADRSHEPRYNENSVT